MLPESARWPVAGAVLFLALLMVSTVRYRTFKDLKLSKKSVAVFVVVLVGGIVIATQVHPSGVLVAYFMVYLVAGLLESAFLLGRRLREGRATAALESMDEDEQEGDETPDVDEQEVL